MEHHIRLHPEPFIKIKEGKKTIESRLNDEKRQAFKVGDSLTFISRVDNSKIPTTILSLHYHPTFKELFSTHPPEKFGGGNSNDLLKEIELFYSPEEQEKYSVVGIEFKIK